MAHALHRRDFERSLVVQLIGWSSSLILLLTIAKQIHKQWHDHSSEGVSKWLFIGQLTASIGFTIYSLMLRNWVFAVTNTLMAASAILGMVIVMHHRRRHHG